MRKYASSASRSSEETHRLQAQQQQQYGKLPGWDDPREVSLSPPRRRYQRRPRVSSRRSDAQRIAEERRRHISRRQRSYTREGCRRRDGSTRERASAFGQRRAALFARPLADLEPDRSESRFDSTYRIGDFELKETLGNDGTDGKGFLAGTCRCTTVHLGNWVGSDRSIRRGFPIAV